MKHLRSLFSILTFLLLIGCVNTKQFQKPLPKTERIGIVSTMDDPYFVEGLSKGGTENFVRGPFTSNMELRGYTAFLPKYNLDSRITNRIATHLKKLGYTKIYRLRNPGLSDIWSSHGLDTNAKKFIVRMKKRYRLNKVIVVATHIAEPSLYKHTFTTDSDSVMGYGIYYPDAWIHHDPWLFANYTVQIVDAKSLKSLAYHSNMKSHELKNHSQWKPKFSQLSPNDITNLKRWLTSVVIPAVSTTTQQVLNAN